MLFGCVGCLTGWPEALAGWFRWLAAFYLAALSARRLRCLLVGCALCSLVALAGCEGWLLVGWVHAMAVGCAGWLAGYPGWLRKLVGPAGWLRWTALYSVWLSGCLRCLTGHLRILAASGACAGWLR